MADTIDTTATRKIDIYQASVPVVLRTLRSLKGILSKAEAWATERKIDQATVLSARLALDMFPLVRQVQIVSDNAKGLVGRLGGAELPSFADTETTFAELQARLDKTIEFVESVPADGFEGADHRQVVLKFPNSTFEFTGCDYLTSFALPNIFFHTTTAYAILRHNGVPLGKMDFIGG